MYKDGDRRGKYGPHRPRRKLRNEFEWPGLEGQLARANPTSKCPRRPSSRSSLSIPLPVTPVTSTITIHDTTLTSVTLPDTPQSLTVDIHTIFVSVSLVISQSAPIGDRVQPRPTNVLFIERL